MVTVITSVLLFLALIGMLGAVGYILARGNNNRMTRLFVVCQFSVVLWLISQLLILFSVSRGQLLTSYLIGNAGICTLAPFWFMFSAEYSEMPESIKKIISFMPVISAGMFVCIAANPLHNLYYSQFGTDGISYGCLFYVFQILFYILIISGIVIMLVHSRSALRLSVTLTLAAAVPLTVNLLTVSGIIRSKVELTPLFFAFSVIMVFIAIRKYGLLNINRIAISDTIDNIPTAVIIFNPQGNATYKNRSAEALIKTVFSDYSGFEKAVSELSGNDISGDSSEITIDGERYSLKTSLIKSENDAEIARVVLISSVSEFYELAEAEKRLSIEQERNRIAQEIHDSAGHTFTMISSLAKIMQAQARSGNADIPQILEYTSEIDGLSRSGITQLRCSINNLRDDEFMTSVTRAVRTVTSAVRNIDIDICVQGNEDEKFSSCVREVYDSVKETVTNAMRYSSADRIDIILKFLDDRLELYIFDNGKGCSEIKENNGLSGIRERIENIGGTVKFSSVAGDGFTTIIKIPVK